MSILVTGGAGFIGSNIVDQLIELDYNTVIVDNLSSGKEEYISPEADFYNIDIVKSELDIVFKKEQITHVIHQAAQIDVQRSLNDPLYDVKNNVLGTLNLLQLCYKYGVEKFIYASSAAVYGHPDYLPIDEEHPVKSISPYGISKHTPEHYLEMYGRLYNLDYTILRYANVYGPRQDASGEGGVIAIFIDRMLAKDPPVIYGNGEQTRDFIYVKDVARANIKALERGGEEILNISCNTKVSVNRIYKIINDILNKNLKPICNKERKGDIKHSILKNERAKEMLNWEPEYELEEGLLQTIAFYAREKGIDEVAATLEDK